MPRGGKRERAGRQSGPGGKKVQALALVTPALRAKLDHFAKARKKSLSWTIERLLERKLADVEWRGDHHFWFGLLMARVGWEVEQRYRLNPPGFSTSKGWMHHPSAAKCVRATLVDVLDDLLDRMVPKWRDATIPEELKRTPKQLPPSLSKEQLNYFNSEEGLAREFARGIIDDLLAPTPEPAEEPDDDFDDYKYMTHAQDQDVMPKIVKGLGLAASRNKGAK